MWRSRTMFYRGNSWYLGRIYHAYALLIHCSLVTNTGISASRTYFTNKLTIVNQTWWKFYSAHIQVVVKWLPGNFSFGTAVVLSWHVKSFVVRWCHAMELHQTMFRWWLSAHSLYQLTLTCWDYRVQNGGHFIQVSMYSMYSTSHRPEETVGRLRIIETVGSKRHDHFPQWRYIRL